MQWFDFHTVTLATCASAKLHFMKRTGRRMKQRKTNHKLFVSIAIALVVATTAQAQQYPIKPVKVIIPFPPAGPTDIFGRMTADILTKTHG